MPERVQSSKELQREFFSFPNSLSAILYLSPALRFLHSTLFFLFFSALLLSSTGAQFFFFFFCLARWQANQSSFFLCPRRGFCMRRQDGGIHRIHKYARAPDTKKKVQQGDCKDSRHLHCKVQKTRQHKKLVSRQRNTLYLLQGSL